MEGAFSNFGGGGAVGAVGAVGTVGAVGAEGAVPPPELNLQSSLNADQPYPPAFETGSASFSVSDGNQLESLVAAPATTAEGLLSTAYFPSQLPEGGSNTATSTHTSTSTSGNSKAATTHHEPRYGTSQPIHQINRIGGPTFASTFSTRTGSFSPHVGITTPSTATSREAGTLQEQEQEPEPALIMSDIITPSDTPSLAASPLGQLAGHSTSNPAVSTTPASGKSTHDMERRRKLQLALKRTFSSRLLFKSFH